MGRVHKKRGRQWQPPATRSASSYNLLCPWSGGSSSVGTSGSRSSADSDFGRCGLASLGFGTSPSARLLTPSPSSSNSGFLGMYRSPSLPLSESHDPEIESLPSADFHPRKKPLFGALIRVACSSSNDPSGFANNRNNVRKLLHGIMLAIELFLSSYHSIGVSPCSSKYVFAFENGFEPKKRSAEKGDGCALSRIRCFEKSMCAPFCFA
jgi:hypothetical protein